MRHGMRITHTKTLAAGLYQTSALPSLAVFGSGGPIGASACAVAYVRRTRGVIGRVDCGAIDGRGMCIRVVSSARSNSDETDQCIFSEDTAESNSFLEGSNGG